MYFMYSDHVFVYIWSCYFLQMTFFLGFYFSFRMTFFLGFHISFMLDYPSLFLNCYLLDDIPRSGSSMFLPVNGLVGLPWQMVLAFSLSNDHKTAALKFSSCSAIRLIVSYAPHNFWPFAFSYFLFHACGPVSVWWGWKLTKVCYVLLPPTSPLIHAFLLIIDCK